MRHFAAEWRRMRHFAAEWREVVKIAMRAAPPGAALNVDTSANDHKHIFRARRDHSGVGSRRFIPPP
jgi:hypothetical protein